MTTEVTNEGLARMIAEGFGNVDRRFEDVDRRFEDVDRRFEDVGQKIGEVKVELANRLDNLDARVGRIEADIHELREEQIRRHEFEDVRDRVKYIEKKLGIESGV